MLDLLQEIRLNDLSARRAAEEVSDRNRDADFMRLEKLVRKMALVNQALFELLKERTGITDTELRRKVSEIDLRDGNEGGRLDAAPGTCPHCKSIVTASALRCQICGGALTPEYPFEA